MFWHCAITTIVCIASSMQLGNSFRILAICPRASVSHQIVFRGLTLALNERGHELIVVTTNPTNDPSLKNYTEIDIGFVYDTNSKEPPARMMHWLKSFPKLSIELDSQSDLILDNAELKKLYAPDSNEKFDLILLELIYWPAFFPLAKRFDAPIIGLSPMGLTMNVQYALGNPIMTSHPSNWDLYTESNGSLSFYQRLANFVTFWQYLYYYHNVFTPSQEAIARKYFGDDIPDLGELEKNISLVFVNEPMPISFLKPNVPNIIRINGLHIPRKIDPLPENLQKTLDKATQGFVYMSLGSNMKSTMLSNETLNEFTAAFSMLPYKVLWKFESDILPGKPENVHIMKWVPQQAVLAHPNLKVFVYQGGLQSTEEAVSNAVPLIGIPTWADQRMQVDRMVSLGAARKLDISKINRNDLESAIRSIALDNSYKKNMLKLRELLKDTSRDLLKNAIWWTEHVIRNKGASYLHSSTADLPWYHRNDMDVVAFITTGFAVLLGILSFLVYRLMMSGITVYNFVSASKHKKVI